MSRPKSYSPTALVVGLADSRPTPPAPVSADGGRHGKRSSDSGSSSTPSSSALPPSGRTSREDPALNPTLSATAPPRSSSGPAKKPYGFEPAQHTPSAASAAPADDYPPLAPRRDRHQKPWDTCPEFFEMTPDGKHPHPCVWWMCLGDCDKWNKGDDHGASHPPAAAGILARARASASGADPDAASKIDSGNLEIAAGDFRPAPAWGPGPAGGASTPSVVGHSRVHDDGSTGTAVRPQGRAWRAGEARS